MATLLLKLAGPLQSWGSESRFNERKTRHEPTKSGVIGLLAAALGRRRTEDVSDLAELTMAVRIDQPGHIERDFQSAHTRRYDKNRQAWVFDKAMPLSNRYYLSDAVFVVGLDGDPSLLAECASALNHPCFPLYLGRRSCPPSDRVFLAYLEDACLMQALKEWQWEASPNVQKRHSEEIVLLELVRDCTDLDGDEGLREDIRDVPLSFSQEYRQYTWRTVVHDRVSVLNAHAQPEHDPMLAVAEATR